MFKIYSTSQDLIFSETQKPNKLNNIICLEYKDMDHLHDANCKQKNCAFRDIQSK